MEDIKHILYPTDFSDNAKNALPYLVDLVKKTGSKLTLLHVASLPVVPPVGAYTTIDQTVINTAEGEHQHAKIRLQNILIENGLTDQANECVVKVGNVTDEILDTLKDESIDLIVMGTKGESAEKGLFMGSIAKAVIQDSSCPVMAIPDAADFSEIKHIVYATDLQHDESTKVGHLVRIAKLFGARLTVLHIDHDEEVKEWSQDLLMDIINEANYENIRFEELVGADPAQAINDFVNIHQADILAMTTHTTTLFDKLFHRSLTKEMLLHTEIPLIGFNLKKYSTVFLA